MQRAKQQFLAFRVFRFRDADAYQTLYREYVEPIERQLSLKLPRREDVDELTSEVFLRGWEYMTANRVEHPQAFFFRIAGNLVAEFYRKAKPTEELDEASAVPAAGSLAEDVASSDALQQLLEKVSRLKDEYQAVIRLKYIEERSIEEIARELGKSATNVRVLLYRAKRAFQKL
ncbi:sigma-70 family RNA polymerase sigma factor [Candidatus Uhrbacteria bacterium]|nr:sigma-70 family RNA polymerase sigma factor [Candidatus Uhrbacteria bacterium]